MLADIFTFSIIPFFTLLHIELKSFTIVLNSIHNSIIETQTAE